MTLKEMKLKVLGLIEEWNPNNEKLTDDPDIATKLNEVINQVMYEICTIKKFPKFVEMAVNKGDVITFDDIGMACGYDVFQLGTVCGVPFDLKADGTVLRFKDSGTAEIDCYVFPERITAETKDSYEFEVSNDVLEIMPYGIAADVLKSDASAEYGSVYATRYESMLQRLEQTYTVSSIYVEGGVRI
jgi:hypothetical protein